MTATETEMFDGGDELDFSGDQIVERVEAVFVISSVETEDTDSPKGKGKRLVLEFNSDDLPFPVTVKKFYEYTPVDPDKSTQWMKQQRGEIRQLMEAACGTAKGVTFADLQGKVVGATTKDNGEGFTTLFKFKPVKIEE